MRKQMLSLLFALSAVMSFSVTSYADYAKTAVSVESSEAVQDNAIEAEDIEDNAVEEQNASTLSTVDTVSTATPKTLEAEAEPAEEASSKVETEEPSSTSSEQLVAYAKQFIGNPYRYGGTSLTSGADCSGFLMSVYAQFGISLPHSSAAVRSVGTQVPSLAEAIPGDILAYSGHVGIYLGNGQMLSALNRKSGITITSATYKSIKSIRRVL